jgi:hypothetical protein
MSPTTRSDPLAVLTTGIEAMSSRTTPVSSPLLLAVELVDLDMAASVRLNVDMKSSGARRETSVGDWVQRRDVLGGRVGEPVSPRARADPITDGRRRGRRRGV